MATTGNTTVDFGSIPGTNIASVTVTGQGSILATSHAEAFMMGNDSTTDHSAYEHQIVPIALNFSVGNVVAGTGFTVYAQSELRLTGKFKARWVWSD